MIVGRLDRRITIEQPTASQDAYGEPVESWGALATVWAQVQPLRGEERFEAQQVGAERTVRFRIRYRSDVTEQMRVVYDGDVYDITAVLELGRREGLEILAVAQVP